MQHLTENNLIKDSQHGFMTGRSCTTNLVIFLDKITEIIDKGKQTDIFYLDFAKAFDKVPKARLLQKMTPDRIMYFHISELIQQDSPVNGTSTSVGRTLRPFTALLAAR